MAARDKPLYEQAYADYKNGLAYKDIAKKHNVSLNTVKSWKTRHWNKMAQESVHAKKSTHTNKKGGQPGNKNALGNKGGLGTPVGETRALKHGLFAKYVPKETMEIMADIGDMSLLDILWRNIQIQYAAIIRAQSIMYVDDKEDTTKMLKKSATGDSIDSVEWEYSYAWDKQGNFLKAQSRAMTTLQGMIKRYEEMLRSDMATEEQELRIQKLKKDLRIDTSTEDKLKSYFDKLGGEIDGLD